MKTALTFNTRRACLDAAELLFHTQQWMWVIEDEPCIPNRAQLNEQLRSLKRRLKRSKISEVGSGRLGARRKGKKIRYLIIPEYGLRKD